MFFIGKPMGRSIMISNVALFYQTEKWDQDLLLKNKKISVHHQVGCNGSGNGR